MSTLKNKDARETEAEWLCKQAVDQLGIGNFLRQAGWEDDQADLVIAHIGWRPVSLGKEEWQHP